MFGRLQVSEVFLIMHVQAFHVLDYPERLRKLLVSTICCCLVALFPADPLPSHARRLHAARRVGISLLPDGSRFNG